MREMFIDSSALFAWGDRDSAEGEMIRRELLAEQIPLVTTNLVFAELISLVTKRVGKHAGIRLGERIEASKLIQIVHVDAHQQRDAWELYRKYRDKDFDLIDAASFVVCRHRGIREVFTLDRHFAQMGFQIR